jgi:hypothetical protein
MEINNIPIATLENIKNKIWQMIESNKNSLQQVLRFYMFEYTAPFNIEGCSKYIILHHDTIKK